MKQNKFMRFMTSRALILTLQVVASGVLLYFVYLTKLLPVKYFAILAAVLAVLVLLLWIIIQTGKKKIVEGKTSKRTIISKVLSLIVSIVLVIGSTFAARGNTFLNNVQTTTQKYAINVIVLKDGDYGTASLDGLKGVNFGRSYEKEKATLNKALAQMEETIDTQKYTTYDTYSQLADALYNKEVDAIVVGTQYKSMLELNHEGFDEETRIEMGKEDLLKKPENIRAKIVEGRVNKLMAERCLLEQPFVKDPNQTIAQSIEGKMTIKSFTRYELGEGLEKRQDNFAEEVMAQVKG